jgi:hypothetical protein
MKKEPECIQHLKRLGIDGYHAHDIRRIAMTLHRWHELECGVDGGCIQRDDTGIPYWFNANARFVGAGDRRAYSRIADRETAALRRLAKIMANYPRLSFYVQGDPRGASLYILRPGDVPESENADSYYSRGVAVYK